MCLTSMDELLQFDMEAIRHECHNKPFDYVVASTESHLRNDVQTWQSYIDFL